MDFNFHIQNFSTVLLEKTIPPGSQATIGYTFVPADAFAGRPFGLSINLAYRDNVMMLILIILYLYLYIYFNNLYIYLYFIIAIYLLRMENK